MPEANPYLETLQSESATGAAPGNPYLDMLQAGEQMRKTQTAAAVTLAVGTNPEEYAKRKRVAQYLGYPPAAVDAMPDLTKQQAQVKQVQQDIADSPVLQRKFSDQDFARLAHDDSGTLSVLANSFKRGWAGLRELVPGAAFRANSNALKNFDEVEAKLAAGEVVLDTQDPLGLRFMTPDQRQQLKATFVEKTAVAATKVAAREAEKRTYPQPEVAGRVAQAQSFGGAVRQFLTDPVTYIASIGPESLVQNVPGLAAGGVAGRVGGAALGAATAGAGSFITDYNSALLEALGKAGVDVANADALAAAAKDQKLMQSVAAQAFAHATMVGAFDAVSGGAASRVALPAGTLAARPVARELANLGAQIPVQGALGGAGELGGQVAAGQDIEPGAILAEIVGEGFGAPAEVTALAMGQVQQRMQQAKAEADAKALQDAFKLAAESKTRERAPDSFATLVQELADGSPDAPKQVRFDARTLLETLQQSGLEQAELEQMLPSVMPQLDEAVAVGGEVVVPLGEFSKVAGTDLEQSLLQNARIGDNELSQAESKQAGEQAAALMQQQAEQVLQQAGDSAAARVEAETVRTAVLDQLNTAGRFRADVNEAYAALVRDFYVTMAGRMKTTPDALYAQYPLTVRAEGVGALEQKGADTTFTDSQGGRYTISVKPQVFGAGQTKANAVMVELRDAQTGERRGFVDFSVREDGVLTSENTKVAPDYQKRGLAVAMYKAARDAGFDIAPGRVQTDQGLKMVESLQRQGLVNKEAAGPRFRAGDLTLAQGPRGTFNPAALNITLLQDADLSTFLHESGHLFLDLLWRFASDPQAPADVQTDMAAVLKWFKTTPEQWSAWTDEYNATGKVPAGMRKQHERFAEGFEQYLLEGKAPSVELQPLFSKFRSWVIQAYKLLKDHVAEFVAKHGEIQLSDEVRSVFDRLLASQEQIARAEALRNFDPLKVPGMAPAERAGYEALGVKASDKSLDTMAARSIKDMKWTRSAHSKALKALQQDVAAKRKEVEAEVRAEVAKEPVRQAIRWLRKGEMTTAEGEQIRAEKGFRLNTEALAEMYPESMLARPDLEKLKGLTAGNGLHPDVVAGMFGFSSGDELVRSVIDAEPEASVVEGMTDQRMLERYGDLATEAGMQRAADEAVHNEARGRFLATGLKALQDAQAEKQKTPRGGSVSVMVRAAKDFAAQLVARRKVRELRAGQHTAAEARAGKAAQKALTKGDVAGAITAQRDQLLNHYAARETYAALDEVDRALVYLKKFDKESVRKGLPAEYLEQIDKLLERVDLRTGIPLGQLDKRAKLADWIKAQADMGVEVDLPAEVLEDARLTSYKDLPLETFRGLVDTVKQVEHLGRLKEKLLTAKDERAFSATRDAIVASILANGQGRTADTRTPTTNLGRALASVRKFGAAHIKAAAWARIMDGGKDGGPVWEYFVRSANERGDKETTMLAKATKDLSAIMAPLLKHGKLGGSGQFFPSIKRSLNRESVLAIALNVGNESNLQRLLGGEGWTADQLQPVLDTLTKEDWAAVQKVWDYFETFRPLIGEKEQRVHGKQPDWIEAGSTLADRYGVKGGYYPVKYDPAASQRAEEHADAEGARRQLQGAYGAATTRRSFTKGRAEEVTGRPLLYTLQGVYSGVTEVIHDLAWHEWLIDVNRLLKSKQIDSAIRETYGPEVVRQLKSWRDDIAEGNAASDRALDMALGYLRQSVSVAGLGFNVVSALMQPLGLLQSMQRVGVPWIARGIQQTIGRPVAASREVNAKSSFMENRARTRFRELNELRNRVQGQSAFKRVVSENAFRLMMAFQRIVDVPTWLGAYEKAIAEGNEEARAVALADQAVIDSQGGGQVKDLSAIERGPQALKLFTTFYSFMNTALNLGVVSGMTARSRGKLAADMLMLFVLPAVLGSLLKDAITPGDAGDDDEELAKKLAGEQLSYLLGMLVVGREFGQAARMLTGADAHDYTGPAGLRAITDSYQFVKQAGQGEFDDAFRKAAVNLAGDLFGLPSAQINRSITGAQALSEGKTGNPAALLTGYQEPR